MINDQQVTISHVTIPSGYFALDREQRRAFLRSILNGMSPNEEVRKSSQKLTTQRIKDYLTGFKMTWEIAIRMQQGHALSEPRTLEK